MRLITILLVALFMGVIPMSCLQKSSTPWESDDDDDDNDTTTGDDDDDEDDDDDDNDDIDPDLEALIEDICGLMLFCDADNFSDLYDTMEECVDDGVDSVEDILGDTTCSEEYMDYLNCIADADCDVLDGTSGDCDDEIDDFIDCDMDGKIAHFWER